MKNLTVKVTERYGKNVLATVTLVPTSYARRPVGQDPYWTVMLGDVVLGTLQRHESSQSFPLGGGSRLARNGVTRTYWDGAGPGPKRTKATHTTYNETRLDVLRPLVKAHFDRLAFAAAREEAKVTQHYLRVENVPGYAMPKAPAGAVYAAYWMDSDRRVPVAVFRSTDATVLAEFAATLNGKRFWESEESDRGAATVALTDDVTVAAGGHGWDAVYDKVTEVALRQARA